MGRRGIKVEFSGAKADWNGTFPLLQPSSRTFLHLGRDTAGAGKEGGMIDGGVKQMVKNQHSAPPVKENVFK